MSPTPTQRLDAVAGRLAVANRLSTEARIAALNELGHVAVDRALARTSPLDAKRLIALHRARGLLDARRR